MVYINNSDRAYEVYRILRYIEIFAVKSRRLNLHTEVRRYYVNFHVVSESYGILLTG